MSLRRVLVAASLAVLMSVGSYAQTLDEVLQKHYEAMGGLAAIKAVNTIVMSGIASGRGQEINMTMTLKRPNMLKVEMTFNGAQFLQVYDGKTAWMLAPAMGMNEPTDLPAERAGNLIEQADMDGVLINYKEKGDTLSLIGKEDFEGKPAFHIKCQSHTGKESHYFIDAGTYLQTAKRSKVEMQPGQESEITAYMTDYRAVGAIKMPFSVQSKVNGETLGGMTFEKIDINVPVEDSAFAKPAQ